MPQPQKGRPAHAYQPSMLTAAQGPQCRLPAKLRAIQGTAGAQQAAAIMLTHRPGLGAHNVNCHQRHPSLLSRLPPHSLLNRFSLQPFQQVFKHGQQPWHGRFHLRRTACSIASPCTGHASSLIDASAKQSPAHDVPAAKTAHDMRNASKALMICHPLLQHACSTPMPANDAKHNTLPCHPIISQHSPGPQNRSARSACRAASPCCGPAAPPARLGIRPA